MARAPTTRSAPKLASAPAPTPATTITNGDKIRMLTGQEGPSLSRVRNQVLEVGVDLGATEAQRLIDVDFAERA